MSLDVPETLPTREEFAHPHQWVERVVSPAGEAAAGEGDGAAEGADVSVEAVLASGAGQQIVGEDGQDGAGQHPVGVAEDQRAGGGLIIVEEAAGVGGGAFPLPGGGAGGRAQGLEPRCGARLAGQCSNSLGERGRGHGEDPGPEFQALDQVVPLGEAAQAHIPAV